MKRWIDNNPLGVALAAACSVLVLASALLAYVWSRPASSGLPEPEADGQFEALAQGQASDIGPISNYREFTERPVFDPTRKPAVNVDDENLEGDEEVADAPEVRLTGVIITPEAKLVTLKPLSNAESVVAREGEALEGEYIGWTVSAIRPRSVALESRDGESLELDLEVNTRRIEEPPKPEPPAVAEADNEEGQSDSETAVAEGEEPMSRAEEIRQRIAERRAELRRQAAEDDDDGGGSRANRRAATTSAYQTAIQNMINRRKRDNNEDDEDGENEEDG